MKRILTILLTICTASILLAQDFDRMTIADTDIQGTARYVAMSGAFAALGGDVSAVQDNPAAVGVFRRTELSLSADWLYGWNKTATQSNWSVTGKWNIPHISLVWSLGNAQKQKGMIYNNIILQYHQVKSYNNTTRLASTQVNSYTDWMAISANEQGVQRGTMMYTQVWKHEDVGWLSALGAKVGLIKTNSTTDQWHSILGEGEHVASALEVQESGSLDAYSLGWGSNIGNRVYVGVMANFNTLNYSKQTSYTEVFEEGGEFDLNSVFHTKGFGLNGAVGVIYRPLEFLRIGASFQTPTWMSVQTANYANIHTDGIAYGTPTEANTYVLEGHYIRSEYMLPMRAVAGVAFQVGMRGLISLEYDYTHAFDHAATDTHWLRAGTEWIINSNWFLRAGYAYKSDFGASKDMQLLWMYNTTRTDMDYRIKQWEQYASAGFGFRNKRWVIDLAYQCHWGKSNHTMLEDWPAQEIQSQEHRIVLTLAWTQFK